MVGVAPFLTDGDRSSVQIRLGSATPHRRAGRDRRRGSHPAAVSRSTSALRSRLVARRVLIGLGDDGEPLAASAELSFD
jgi:hypothetical protein